MLRAARLLNLRRIRQQPLRAILAVIAVAGGVGLGASLLVVRESVADSYAKFGRALGGPAKLRVVGATARGGLDEGVLPAVDRTPGVEAAVPVVQAVTFADRGDGRRVNLPTIVAVGVDCRVEAFVGSFGCSPESIATAKVTDPPLMSPSLARRLGPGASLRTDAGRMSLDGAVTADQLERLSRSGAAVVVYPLPVAQKLFARPQRLDAIYIKPAAGTNLADLQRRLQTAVGGWNGVLTSTDPPPGATVILNGFLPLFSMLAIFGIGVAVVLVYDTVALSVEERRRDLAVVAAVGGEAKTVVGGTVAEAAVLGLVGGLLGGLGAIVLARPILASLSGFSERFTGLRLTVHATATPFIVGAVLGTLMAGIAAWLPARRAMRMDVAAELSNRGSRDEAAPRVGIRRSLIFLGIGCVAIVVCWFGQRDGALSPWQPIAAQAAVGIAATVFIIAAGTLAPVALSALLRARPGGGAPVRLGLANLVRDPGRTGTMAAAVAAPVAVAFIIASFVSSIHDAVTEGVTKDAAGYVRTSMVPPNNSINIDAGLSPAIVEKLSHLPGVERVARGNALLVGQESVDNIGVKGAEYQDSFPFVVYRGTKDRARFDRGEVLVGPALARRRGLHPGSRLRLPTPTGWAYVTVQGIWADGDFNGSSVSMPYSLLERLYGPQPVRGVGLKVAPGVRPEAIRHAVLDARLDPAISALTPSDLADQVSNDIQGIFASFWAIQRALLLVAFVAVLATLLLVGIQRRRELALLSAVGMRPSELSRMIVLEAVAVGIAGTLFAVITGAGMYTGLHLVIPIFIGFHDPFRLNLSSVPVWGAIATTIVVLAAILPAWRTARIEVVENLQYE